ncbi:hypothetical protein EIP86_001437 [Pleurotus ostreatoroseus]|nr:hypothetical protein EIP86_001437 [Pleurotus ostreatoroseus]
MAFTPSIAFATFIAFTAISFTAGAFITSITFTVSVACTISVVCTVSAAAATAASTATVCNAGTEFSVLISTATTVPVSLISIAVIILITFSTVGIVLCSAAVSEPTRFDSTAFSESVWNSRRRRSLAKFGNFLHKEFHGA